MHHCNVPGYFLQPPYNTSMCLRLDLHKYLVNHRSVEKRFHLKFMEQPLTRPLLKAVDTVEKRWYEPHQLEEEFER